jgi:mRNA interferase HigB
VSRFGNKLLDGHPIVRYTRVMRVLGKRLISKTIAKHADACSGLQAWLAEAEAAEWTSPQDVKRRYPSASLVREGRVIFNIRGNKYRLVVKVAYRTGVVLVEWFGTHAEYSKKKF